MHSRILKVIKTIPGSTVARIARFAELKPAQVLPVLLQLQKRKLIENSNGLWKAKKIPHPITGELQ